MARTLWSSSMNEIETVRVPDVAKINWAYLTYLSPKLKLVVRPKAGVDYDVEYQAGAVTYYYVPYRDVQSLERLFVTASFGQNVTEVDDVVAKATKRVVPADMRGFVSYTEEQYSVVPLWVATAPTWPWHMYNAVASNLVFRLGDEMRRWLDGALRAVERAKYISAHRVDVCLGASGAAVYVYPPVDTELSRYVDMYIKGEGRRLFAQVGSADAEYLTCASVLVLPSNDILRIVVMRDFQTLYERPI